MKVANSTIGSRIRKARDLSGLTQEELGEKIGIGDKSVSAIERNLNYPSLETLCKISTVLGVSCDYILMGEEHGVTPTTFERIKYLSPKYQKILNDQITMMLEVQKNKE